MRSQASQDTAVSMASRYSPRELSLISASSGANVALRLWRSSASDDQHDVAHAGGGDHVTHHGPADG